MAEGKVVQTDVIRKSAEDHAGWTYRAKVEYQYTVEGTTYEGDRVSFAGRVSTNNEADALEVIATYREGSKVAVYYDPADPEEAVLEPGLTGMVFLFPVIGGVFLVIGLGLLFALLMGKRKDLEPEPFE